MEPTAVNVNSVVASEIVERFPTTESTDLL